MPAITRLQTMKAHAARKITGFISNIVIKNQLRPLIQQIMNVGQICPVSGARFSLKTNSNGYTLEPNENSMSIQSCGHIYSDDGYQFHIDCSTQKSPLVTCCIRHCKKPIMLFSTEKFFRNIANANIQVAIPLAILFVFLLFQSPKIWTRVIPLITFAYFKYSAK